MDEKTASAIKALSGKIDMLQSAVEREAKMTREEIQRAGKAIEESMRLVQETLDTASDRITKAINEKQEIRRLAERIQESASGSA